MSAKYAIFMAVSKLKYVRSSYTFNLDLTLPLLYYKCRPLTIDPLGTHVKVPVYWRFACVILCIDKPSSVQVYPENKTEWKVGQKGNQIGYLQFM